LDLLVTLDTPRPALLFWFEWRALEALGHLPRINACAECGGEVARGGDFAYAPVRAGIVCGRCADGARPSGAVRTGPDTLAILRALHTDRDGRDAARIVFTAKQALAFPVLFDTFFASFAETVTANRSLALDAVAIRCGQ
jgi:recombinational DNA repair protein (RecF pathway)